MGATPRHDVIDVVTVYVQIEVVVIGVFLCSPG